MSPESLTLLLKARRQSRSFPFNSRVCWATTGMSAFSYCQGESIPNYVKTKLAQLPKAVEKLQDQTATSSLTQGIVYASEGSRLTTKKQ
jgi:hypothetical protein